MGQLALGLRSLLIRLGVFVLLAAALAWALGGTLFPRPEVATFEPVSFDDRAWYWQLEVGGREPGPGRVAWWMMTRRGDEPPQRFSEQPWLEPAGPVATDDAVYFGGRTADGWRLVHVDVTGDRQIMPVPHRLAVERQLARVRQGLPLPGRDAADARRDAVLDAEPKGG